MTEILKAYSKEIGSNPDLWEKHSEVLTDTISYKMFELKWHVKAIGTEIRKIIDKVREWMR